MKTSIPYLERRVRRDKRGRVIWQAWYWVPSKRLRAAGWKVMALGQDFEEAQQLAIRQNRDVQRSAAATQHGGAGTVGDMIRAYRADDEFPKAEATIRSYNQNLNVIERWAGDKPIRAVTPRAVKELKKSLSATPYTANAVIGMIRILYGFAMREGLAELNPASRFKRLTVRPRHQVWMSEQEAAFAHAAADAGKQSLWIATALSLYAGQRQTDVLAMTWQQFDGYRLRVRQSKTGEFVEIPALGPLPVLLTNMNRTSTYIVVSEATRRPYKPDHFRHEMAAVMSNVGLKGELQYRDLRRTSVVRMYQAGLEIEEISDITGHRIERTREIIETYLPRGHRLRPASVQKLRDYYDKE